MTNASVDLNKLEAFLFQEAVARQFGGDSSEWTQHVLTHIHSCGTKRSRALLGQAAPGAGAQEREPARSIVSGAATAAATECVEPPVLGNTEADSNGNDEEGVDDEGDDVGEGCERERHLRRVEKAPIGFDINSHKK